MRGIDPFYFNTAPNLTVATYFASKEYIAKNEAVVDRFVTAMKKSLDYAQATRTRSAACSPSTPRSRRRRRRRSTCRSGSRI